MKVAIVHPSLAVRGGAENVVIWLAHELHRRGHGVSVITTDYDDALHGARDALPFRVLTLPLGGYAMKPVAFVRAGWMLRRVLDGFDLINIQPARTNATGFIAYPPSGSVSTRNGS